MSFRMKLADEKSPAEDLISQKYYQIKHTISQQEIHRRFTHRNDKVIVKQNYIT